MKTIICISLCLLCSNGFAAPVDVNVLADSIFKAENSFEHPYGVMRSYCLPGDPNGQCKKGCRQTINKWMAKIEYSSANDFIEKFSKIYCPLETYNGNTYNKTPNANWIKNVTFFYDKLTAEAV